MMDDPHLREFFAERAREQKTMFMIEACAVLLVVALTLIIVAVVS